MLEKKCYFCANNVAEIDYTDAETLKRFLDPQAKIMPKRKSGVCAKHQRKLSRAIKRARILGLLPFVSH
ncbi:MAG: 30S ribosomal protein S18 [bacterium]|nr:30S ribosomal protein S18 [bacterium]